MAGRFDVVVVGGGFCGAALATVMARAGYACLALERDEVFVDRTKGEWLAPWGVAEAIRVGLIDDIRRARGHVLRRHVTFGPDIDPDAALAGAVALDLLPGVDGPLTQRHPDACQVLVDAASQAGATVARGVTGIEVAPGARPSVAYEHGGRRHQATARLVVAADGRNSALRRSFGLDLERDPPHHLFTGLLVDGVDDWPEDLQAIGTEGDVHYLAFPQGGGRARLYLGFGFDRRRWLTGAAGPRRFLDAFGRLDSLPGGEWFADANPASGCAVYPNEATWLPDPTAVEGVVFVGDAAGWDDPITGQGLSVTLRDVRVVTELLVAADRWDRAALAPYTEERAERMRRLRFASSMSAVIANEFGPAADERRRVLRQRTAADRRIGMGRSAAFVGPDALPAEAFTPEAWDLVFA